MKTILKSVVKFLIVIGIVSVGVDVYNHGKEVRLWANLRENVVKVTLDSGGGGTGFALKTKEGVVILTNDHICAGQTHLNVIHGRHKHSGTVIRTSPKYDSCLIDIGDAILEFQHPLVLSSAMPSRGDKVFQGGHPGLRPFTPSSGYVIELTEITLAGNPDKKGNCAEGDTAEPDLFGIVCLRKMREILNNVPTFPGNSGSPVVNEDGYIVGLTNAGDRMGNGAMIPVDDIKRFLDDSLL